MQPGQRTTRAATSLRHLGQRFSFIFLLSLATALLIMGRAGSPLVESLRTTIVDGMAPVLDAVSRPVLAVNYLLEQGKNVIFIYDENAKLRADNTRLQQWQAVARQLEQENANYRALLNIQPEAKISYITARVIGDAGGPFVRTLIMNAGLKDGVSKGQAIVNGEGVIGRIVTAGQRSSRILLLTDLNSRVPVVVEGTRYRGILAGDNEILPRLTFLPMSAKVRPGDRIVTSGHGGLFPPGLPVGNVASTSGGVVRVQPHVDRDRVEFVRALRYDVASPPIEGGQESAKPAPDKGS